MLSGHASCISKVQSVFSFAQVFMFRPTPVGYYLRELNFSCVSVFQFTEVVYLRILFAVHEESDNITESHGEAFDIY